ncbi:PRC-barrel domain-containing protein [Salaquimonas pukyongi]|uniref:PRC-barrel domain-containing protein n=1 Tax=Salaquimonas pukyongi TaxID=2712698 RepID=UPI00096B95A1|nr:PRC-barrel domain-containing protein [Salaquimonas pukyongi]
MNNKLAAAIVIASTMTAGAFSAAETAAASEYALFDKPIALAYAPQSAPLDNRFEQFEDFEEEHELNDAWLGMPVHSAEGELVGFVEDAYLDENGDVEELLVGLSDQNYAVYIDAKNTSLTESEVAVSLSSNAIAGLERAEDYQLVQR